MALDEKVGQVIATLLMSQEMVRHFSGDFAPRQDLLVS